jgi:hypothetical protein
MEVQNRLQTGINLKKKEWKGTVRIVAYVVGRKLGITFSSTVISLGSFGTASKKR